MHERIRRFSESGVMKDSSNWQQVQDTQRNMLEDRMRSMGYIPHLDCDVHWTPCYDEEQDHFEFKISMYGVFVGRKQSETEAVYYENKVHFAG